MTVVESQRKELTKHGGRWEMGDGKEKERNKHITSSSGAVRPVAMTSLDAGAYNLAVHVLGLVIVNVSSPTSAV